MACAAAIFTTKTKKITVPTDSKIIVIVFCDSAILFACSSRKKTRVKERRVFQPGRKTGNES